MFTGIVSQRATVREIRPAGPAGAARLAVRLDLEPRDLAVGDSVALDGACLTVVERDGRNLVFDVVPETLRRTTLGTLAAGSRVNVETALRLGDAFGGHVVLGHVDAVGTVDAVERVGADVRLTVRVPPRLHGAAVPKGSVAVDGVSLTVGEADEAWFSVYLVPHTLAATGLGEKRLGDRVNVEADALGRYVEHHVRRAMAGRLSPAGEGPPEDSP